MIHKISEYISEEKLDKRIREIAAEISKDYAKKEIRLVCILKGSIFFMSCDIQHVRKWWLQHTDEARLDGCYK